MKELIEIEMRGWQRVAASKIKGKVLAYREYFRPGDTRSLGRITDVVVIEEGGRRLHYELPQTFGLRNNSPRMVEEMQSWTIQNDWDVWVETQGGYRPFSHWKDRVSVMNFEKEK